MQQARPSGNISCADRLTLIMWTVHSRRGVHMSQNPLPTDFPIASSPGAISGAQPKLLVRKLGDTYQSGPTDEEVYERYLICEDLAEQLAAYASRKMTANPWSVETAVSKVETGVLKKVDSGVWDFSAGEAAWTIKRTRQILTHLTAGEALAPLDSNSSTPAGDQRHEK